MPETAYKTRSRTRRKVLLGTLVVLVLSFCGWIYKAKTQSDLNRQLIVAARTGDTEAAQLLLTHGADPNARDAPQSQFSLLRQIREILHMGRESPGDQANLRKHTVLEVVLESKSTRNRDVEEIPAENVSLVKALLEAGANPNVSSNGHITPLMTAVSLNQLKTVETLPPREIICSLPFKSRILTNCRESMRQLSMIKS